jgi:hypothetical protein
VAEDKFDNEISGLDRLDPDDIKVLRGRVIAITWLDQKVGCE